jgi:hypothetical protein
VNDFNKLATFVVALVGFIGAAKALQNAVKRL